MSYTFTTGTTTTDTAADTIATAIESTTGDRSTARAHRGLIGDIVARLVDAGGYEHFIVSVNGHNLPTDEHTHEGWSAVSVTVHDAAAPAVPEQTG